MARRRRVGNRDAGVKPTVAAKGHQFRRKGETARRVEAGLGRWFGPMCGGWEGGESCGEASETGAQHNSPWNRAEGGAAGRRRLQGGRAHLHRTRRLAPFADASARAIRLEDGNSTSRRPRTCGNGSRSRARRDRFAGRQRRQREAIAATRPRLLLVMAAGRRRKGFGRTRVRASTAQPKAPRTAALRCRPFCCLRLFSQCWHYCTPSRRDVKRNQTRQGIAGSAPNGFML